MDDRSQRFRRRLVADVERRYPIADDKVREALWTIPREAFVPEFARTHGLEAVYRNDVIVTMKDPSGSTLSTSSMPGIMAEMLDRLELDRGHRVLEIGTGTGYNAALLKHIVGPDGTVVSVDIEPSMTDWAKSSLRRTGYEVEVVTGDGRVGHADSAPYDRLIAAASAWDVPSAWFDQLKVGGLLVCPLRLSDRMDAQMAFTLQKQNDRFVSTSVFRAGFLSIRQKGKDLAADTSERADVDPLKTLDLPRFRDGAEAYDFRAFLALHSAGGAKPEDAVEDWLRLGRPGADRMQLGVYYSEPPRSWRALTRGDSTLCFDWTLR